MPPVSQTGLRAWIAHNRGLVFPILIVSALLVVIAPLPALLMDLLLACNVTLAVVVLLTAIHVRRPIEFSVFPSILLGTTLARLVLNIASTRLILTHGADGTDAAGGIIEAFGRFVSGGNLVIGLVLFAIIAIVQFLVITKGATRISEVAARFALDGLPGRQMAVDADLSAGLITSDEASARRAEIAQEADFYGAMDGASKFVRGDSIAAVLITLINIVGGLYIGMFEQGLDFGRAITVFTTLTIGDGLVSQLPAFLISLAAGLLVTRSSADSHLSQDVVTQVFRHPVALFIASGFLASLAFTGLPTIPMLTLSGLCLAIGFSIGSPADQQDEEDTQPPLQVVAVERPEDQLHVHPLELELGVGLLRLADAETGGDLLERVSRVRIKMARELGILMPKVRIRDSLEIPKRSFAIKVRGVAVSSGQCYANALLAITTPRVADTNSLVGLDTTSPGSNVKAKWIESEFRERAVELGYDVIEPANVISTQLAEVVRLHSHELLTRQQVHQLMDHLRQYSPRVVDELVPALMKPSEVQQVLSNLLREQVPIRDLETILETLGHHAEFSRDTVELTEIVRRNLSRSISEMYRDASRTVHAIVLDPELEELIRSEGVTGAESSTDNELCEVVRAAWKAWSSEIKHCVLICRSTLRRRIRTALEHEFPRLPVLAADEISDDTNVNTLERLTAAFSLSR